MQVPGSIFSAENKLVLEIKRLKQNDGEWKNENYQLTQKTTWKSSVLPLHI